MTAGRNVALIVAVLACMTAGASRADDLSRRSAGWPRPDSEKASSDQACAHLGRGYARAPGSDTCVRVGGAVRTETMGVWRR